MLLHIGLIRLDGPLRPSLQTDSIRAGDVFFSSCSSLSRFPYSIAYRCVEENSDTFTFRRLECCLGKTCVIRVKVREKHAGTLVELFCVIFFKKLLSLVIWTHLVRGGVVVLKFLCDCCCDLGRVRQMCMYFFIFSLL